MDTQSGVASRRCVSQWRCRGAMALAVVFPVVLALLLSWYGLHQRSGPFSPVLLQPVIVGSSEQLESLFAHHAYSWPPQAVPPLAIKSLPPDLGRLPVERKKSLFFRTLLPLIVAENARLSRERAWLQQLQERDDRHYPERLHALAREHRIDPEQPRDSLLSELLLRVDVVPAGLVLAQAANESGWGTSRFSREVNNLFGEWTWDASRGVLPQQRPENASHFVRRFDSLRQSVRSYLHNINSGRAYAKLRALRAKMRQQEKALDALVLAQGLERYSARGSDYVQEIQAMIRSNRLNKLGRLDLRR